MTTTMLAPEYWINPELEKIDSSLRRAAFDQQIQHVYNINLRVMVEMLLLVMLTIYLLNKTDANTTHIAIWAIVTTAAIIFRIIARRGYRRKAETQSTNLWAAQSVIMIFLLSCCWAGVPGVFLNPDDLLGVVMITGLVMGLGAGSMVGAIYPPTFLATLLPIFIVMLYRCFTTGDTNSAAFICGILALAGLLAYLSFGYGIYVNTMNAIRVQLVNGQLQQSAETKTAFLETVLNSIQQGLLIADASGNIQQINQRFRHLLGLPGQVRHINEIKQFEMFTDSAQAAFDTDTFHLIADRVQLPDGGQVVTVTDVTESSNRERDLERAKADAESANVAKTRFLAAASHDLRQPVHALGLYFDSLQTRVRNEDTELLLDRVKDSIGVVDQMLSSLLDVSKLDAGVVEPKLQSVSIENCLERIAQEHFVHANASSIQLVVDCEPCMVKSDVAMLDRIIRNLVVNAIKASPGGTVKLLASVKRDDVEISIVDDGIGISSDHIKNVFQEFYQVHNPHRDHRHGLGLGLAIVRGLCDLLNHSVHVESQPGNGSKFVIKIKVDRSNDLVIPFPAYSGKYFLDDDSNLGDKVILIIDDDNAVLDSMRILFDDWGVFAIAADSPDDAIRQLRGDKPDLVISDYRLRDNVTGFEAIATLKQVLDADFPALIITGDTAPDRLVTARESGMRILYKPVKPGQLKTAVRRTFSSMPLPTAQSVRSSPTADLVT